MAKAGGVLLGRLAIVTGGGGGIGRAVCQTFAREGARVAVVDANEDGARQTIETLNGNGDFHAFTADISNSSEVRTVMSDIKSHFSQFPCINVNCAGITRDNFLMKMDEASFDQVLKINLKGTFLVSQAVARTIAENGIPRGSIINISSLVGKVGNIGQCNYSASKAGVIGYTKTAAKELAKFGIRVNAVLPGFIETPMTQKVPERVMEKVKTLIPMGRTGKPEEVAEACLFLASMNSSYITGECIEVTGGFMM